MADDPDSEGVVTVTQDGVTVEKRFTADEFPVPAVKFHLRSAADDAVEIRLTDEIPESLDMERIGFHPDYDGEGWTAYRDHRVEYERTLDPGEEVTTVYGVRVDDPGTGERFLGDPQLESLAPDEDRATPEDVLGRETTQAVRDALAGEGELAGGSDGPSTGVELDLEEPRPAADVELAQPEADAELDLRDPTAPADAETADESGAETDDATDADDDGEADETTDDGAGADGDAEPRSLDDDLPTAVQRGEELAEGTDARSEADDSTDGEGPPSGAVPGNVVAALAAEIRADEVDDEDLTVLRDAIDPGPPRSVEVRIDRLQNRTEDLAAYTDALEEFLDEEGTGREVIESLQAETRALGEDIDAVERELADADEERDDLAADIDRHDDRLAGVEADLTDLEERVAALDDELDGVRSTVEDVEGSVDDLAADTDEDLDEVRDTLDDVQSTVADLEDELDDFRSFRERMREALGT